MEEGKRLSKYIENQGFTKKKFCNEFGFEYNNFTNMLADKRPIGIKIINQIHIALPKLNVHWLLFGEGPEEVVLDNFQTLNEPTEHYGDKLAVFKINLLEALKDPKIKKEIYDTLFK